MPNASSPPDVDLTQPMEPPYVVIQWPDGRGERYVLGSLTRIGRRPGQNDIVVPADFKTISGAHCEIRGAGISFEIVDLNSSNGTFVNGQRISAPTRLSGGDDIRIGNEEAGHGVHLKFYVGQAIPTGLKPPTRAPAAAPPVPVEKPYLVTRWPTGEEVIFAVEQDAVLLGRSSQADLVFPQLVRFVSNRHAEIRRTPDGFTISDLNSRNGTYVNNKLITPAESVPLHDGAVIRIGDEAFGASIGLTFHNPAEEAAPYRGYTALGSVSDLVAVQSVIIGRDPSCGIVLDNPSVSRRHAAIQPYNGGHTIRDLGSANGTFVNGQVVEQALLNVGDAVQIGPYILTYDGRTLSRFDSQGMRMDVLDVYKEVGTPKGRLRILDDISLTVMPREFIALVGGSGAGKSTLLDALNGFRPAKGTVMLNGRNFYKDYNSYRTQLGYVPQYDILHTSLTVERALNYSARLRLPPDVTPAERNKRITEVLDTVGMNEEKVRKTRISALSGGQRKRVSIAAELLAEPKLFFLDEPTSGLDPGLEKKMMYTMRRMADEGRTILLITHATSNIVQVDHVAFLSQGKLVYFGPPQDALDFFEVDDFADIYEKIERNGAEWRKTFVEEKPDHYQRFVLGRQETRTALLPAGPGARQVGGLFGSLGQMFRQFVVFSQRMINIIFSEKLSLAVLVAIMPLIAVFLLMLAKPDTLIGREDVVTDVAAAAETMTDPYTPVKEAQTTLFIMSLAAVLVGLFGASNELVVERSVFLRERMVNLKLLPYLGSKLFIYGIFAVIQCALLLWVMSLKISFPDMGTFLPSPVELYITLFLATMASVAMGLLISSISSSTNMVTYLILILLFVQIIFSGSIFDLRNKAVEPISYLTITHWTLVGMGTTTDVNQLAGYTIGCGKKMEVDEDSIEVDMSSGTPQVNTDNVRLLESDERECRSTPIETKDMQVAYGDDFGTVFAIWLLLIFFGVAFCVATLVALKRLDRT